MVDVPGLVEGAHHGTGLGDLFLKHVERTRILLHLLDGSKPLPEILADKQIIERELAAWNPRLAGKPTLVVLDKLHLPNARDSLPELRALSRTARDQRRDARGRARTRARCMARDRIGALAGDRRARAGSNRVARSRRVFDRAPRRWRVRHHRRARTTPCDDHGLRFR